MAKATERSKRLVAEHSNTLPRVFGDPGMTDIGTPDPRLSGESDGHIYAYALGYVQELAARVKSLCQDPLETPQRKPEHDKRFQSGAQFDHSAQKCAPLPL